ncbi:hypothetical protein [Mesobacillus maritimus]|uniref:hypothetical protein n=1 Tax=Mesobacillus maritimus TaxID=1643336 RepID=UPI00384B62FC
MGAMKSQYKGDKKTESVVADFLDQYFYPKLNIHRFQRITDLDQQHRGMDVVFTANNQPYIVDEKAQLHYNPPLPTFAFEVKYKKNGIWKPGWLFDQTKETQYYLLVWPKRDDVDLKELEVNNIKTTEVMLISRKQLLDYLNNSFQINEKTVELEATAIIHEKQFGKLHTIHPDSTHYYFYTERLAETPINIVIQKNTLKQLALFHFVVYRNKPYCKSQQSEAWLRDEYIRLQR